MNSKHPFGILSSLLNRYKLEVCLVFILCTCELERIKAASLQFIWPLEISFQFLVCIYWTEFYVWLTIYHEYCVQIPTQCTVYFWFIELWYRHMFWASTAHHQEVRFTYVAGGTSEMTVSRLGWNGVQFQPGPLTVILEVPCATYVHLTSWWGAVGARNM
jgi:hypothetical protein